MDGPASDQLQKKLAQLSFSQLAELERFIDFVLQRDAGRRVENELPQHQQRRSEPVLNRPRDEELLAAALPRRPQPESSKPLDVSPDGIRKAILTIFNEHSSTLTSGLLVSMLEGVWKRYGWPEEKLVEGVEDLLDKGIFATDNLDPPRFMLTRKGFEILHEQAPSEPARPERTVQPGEMRVTEARLRAAILGMYKMDTLKRGKVLHARELAHRWVDLNIRSEHLRIGLDMLQGQGYLRMVTEAGERSFKLTEEGYLYLTGQPTPEGLMSLAGEPVSEKNRPQRYPPGDVLQRAVLDLFKMHHADVGSRVTFAIMRHNWRPTGLRDDDLIRGLEILLKEGMVEFSTGSEPAFLLTQTGFKAMNAWSPLASLKKRLTVGQ